MQLDVFEVLTLITGSYNSHFISTQFWKET